MNEQITDEPSLTRRLTDGALVLIAIGAVVAWLWRRIGTSSKGDTPVTPIEPAPFESSVAVPPNGAQV
jgi:hypothetical protein